MTNNSEIYIGIFEITQNTVVKNKPLILSGLFIWETHIYLCVCECVYTCVYSSRNESWEKDLNICIKFKCVLLICYVASYLKT